MLSPVHVVAATVDRLVNRGLNRRDALAGNIHPQPCQRRQRRGRLDAVVIRVTVFTGYVDGEIVVIVERVGFGGRSDEAVLVTEVGFLLVHRRPQLILSHIGELCVALGMIAELPAYVGHAQDLTIRETGRHSNLVGDGSGDAAHPVTLHIVPRLGVCVLCVEVRELSEVISDDCDVFGVMIDCVDGKFSIKIR